MLANFSERNKATKAKASRNIRKGKLREPLNTDFSSNHVVQRAVGFEVEFCNWYVAEALSQEAYDKYDFFYKNSRRLGKGRKILKNNRFMLEGEDVDDSYSCMEIVSEPFSEDEEGFAEMMTFFQELKLFVEVLRQQYADDKVHDRPRSHLACLEKAGLGQLLMPMAVTMQYSFSDNITIRPQSTMGVRMSKLFHFLRDIGVGYDDESRDEQARKHAGRVFTGQSNAKAYSYSTKTIGKASMVSQLALSRYLKDTDGLEDLSDDFRGFFNLVVYYLIAGSRAIQQYPKAFTKVMARTDFAKMFQLLPEEEFTWFTKEGCQEWKNLIAILTDEEVFGVERKDWKDFEEVTGIEGFDSRIRHFSLENPFFSKGTYANRLMYDTPTYVMSQLTSGEWLKSIPEGRDLLTKKHYPNKGRAWRLFSLGSMHEHTDHDREGDLPIFEMRGFGSSADVVELADNLKKWYVYIHELNQGHDYKFGEDHPLLAAES
ncbi:hypothetical protein [Aureibacter tunicatorum]|uniref:Uncharacterized protein n=1 Tax=Aureibacter tunicatorum TaxID=866807 RepID=A0AAE3XTR8_9BACT|nr:hypothetical protein [Aureibacter tunicatorum]MDR6241829.1 hypothetical protein [Aureibacter tunicatorum]BDD07076.1 hypothetical protein AUTU_45590 [Aureibacter tunicatorum]